MSKLVVFVMLKTSTLVDLMTLSRLLDAIHSKSPRTQKEPGRVVTAVRGRMQPWLAYPLHHGRRYCSKGFAFESSRGLPNRARHLHSKEYLRRLHRSGPDQ